MDPGFAGRTVTSASAAPPRVDNFQARPSIKTDIAPEKAVPGVSDGKDVQFSAQGQRELEAREAVRQVIEKHSFYDASNRTIVVQAKLPGTGYVVDQYPDAVTLKMRAYIRDLTARANGTGKYTAEGPGLDSVIA